MMVMVMIMIIMMRSHSEAYFPNIWLVGITEQKQMPTKTNSEEN